MIIITIIQIGCSYHQSQLIYNKGLLNYQKY
jgi:hypothetical protein